MKSLLSIGVVLIAVTMAVVGCKALRGPDETGEFDLSSETFGENYYLFGYSYEDEELYRFPYQGDPLPDIINEGYRVLIDGEVTSLPGFNIPGQMNGFYLLSEFEDLEDARDFYKGYSKVESNLQFETISDTVELYQVWVQQTAAGNYVKLLVRDIQNFEGESGNKYSVVSLVVPAMALMLLTAG